MNDQSASLLHYTINEVFLQHWNGQNEKFYVMRDRESIGLCYVISGSIRYKTEEKTVTLQSGNVALIRKGACYTAYFEAPETIDYLVNFESDGEFFPKDGGDFFIFCPTDPTGFPANLTRLAECVNQNGKTDFCLLQAYFFMLLSSLFAPVASDKKISETVRAVKEDTSFLLGEKELARRCGMSVSAFRRNFRSATGMNPSEYRNAFRISKAKALLSEENENVEQIAERLGFCDGAYFSRFFKKQTGFSPSAYRKHARTP